MGQRIVLKGATVIGDVAMFDTDRTISGQDGDSFTSAEAAADGESFSAQLAAEVFGADTNVTSVFIQSNLMVVGRDGGWTSTDEVAGVIERFFIHYDENAQAS